MNAEPIPCTGVIDSSSSNQEQLNPNTGTRNMADDAAAGPTCRTAL
jgi:hypothetical protein